MSGPRLFTNKERLELARSRASSDPGRLARLRGNADKLRETPLPWFENDWWADASRKPWTQTYPEINHHTNFAVNGPPLLAFDAALLYVLTGEASAAEQAVRVLEHYCAYEFFAKHPDVGLNWSTWCIRLMWAFDLLRDRIKAPLARRVERFLERAVGAVRENDEWWVDNNPGGLYNNHFAWHKLLIGSLGIIRRDDDLLRYALESDQGIIDLIENGSRDDGLWFESSLNYQFTATVPMAMFADEIDAAGLKPDLWTQAFANGRSLAQLFRGPIEALFPDRTLPTVGDCYGRRLAVGSQPAYFSAFSATGDSAIGWLLTGREPPPEALFLPRLPQGHFDPPVMRTRLWPEHGYAALRSSQGVDYWEGSGYTAFVSFEADSVHSHHDKFGLTVFGQGRHLAVDPEALASEEHAFSANVQGALNRTTLPHNTVMVDGNSHRPVGENLRLRDWVDTSELKMLTVDDHVGKVAPGVGMSRTIAVCPHFVLDVFQVASQKEHQYDYLFHGVSSSGSFDIAGNLEPLDLGSAGPWRWLRDSRSILLQDGWSAAASQDGLVCRLDFAGAPGTRVTSCGFPFKDDFSGTDWPMLIVRRHARSTVFAVALQASEAAPSPARVEVRPARHGLLRVAVTVDGRTRHISMRAIKAPEA